MLVSECIDARSKEGEVEYQLRGVVIDEDGVLNLIDGCARDG